MLERYRTSPAVTRQLRSAAVLYLLVALIGPIGLVYVPDKLFVFGDAGGHGGGGPWRRVAAASRHRLRPPAPDDRGLPRHRSSIACSRRSNRRLAQQMAALGFIPVPIVFINTLNALAIVVMLSGAAFLAPFNQPQLEALAYLFVRLHSLGMQLASVFWGLWLIPLGVLTWRSGWAPRFVGVLVAVAGIGYLLEVFARLVVPASTPYLSPVSLPLQSLELVFIVWLLFAGFRKAKPA